MEAALLPLALEKLRLTEEGKQTYFLLPERKS